MSKKITLFCFVHGDDPTEHAFAVEVAETDTVSKLKELIKSKKSPKFDDIAADELMLWKVNIPSNELAMLDPKPDVQTLGVKLSPLSKISKAFPDGVEDEHLHVIVVRPFVFKVPEGIY
jgi:hypothetical protein